MLALRQPPFQPTRAPVIPSGVPVARNLSYLFRVAHPLRFLQRVGLFFPLSLRVPHTPLLRVGSYDLTAQHFFIFNSWRFFCSFSSLSTSSCGCPRFGLPAEALAKAGF